MYVRMYVCDLSAIFLVQVSSGEWNIGCMLINKFALQQMYVAEFD